MILRDENAGIFTVKFNLGEYFGDKPEAFWIILREPKMGEILKIQNAKTNEEKTTLMYERMEDMIEDHNFEKEVNGEAVKITAKEVWQKIMKRSDAAALVSERWSQECPLFKRRSKESEESQATV